MNFRTSFQGMFVHPPFLSIGMFASRELFPHLEMLILVTVGLTKSDGTVVASLSILSKREGMKIKELAMLFPPLGF